MSTESKQKTGKATPPQSSDSPEIQSRYIQTANIITAPDGRMFFADNFRQAGLLTDELNGLLLRAAEKQ